MKKIAKMWPLLIVVMAVLVLSGCTGDSKESAQVQNNSPVRSEGDKSTTAGDDLAQYDGQVYKIKSTDGKVQGEVGLKFGELSGEEVLQVGYFMMINDDLPVKQTSADFREYSYMAQLTTDGNARLSDDGEIGAVVCNKDSMIDVLEAIDNSISATDMYTDCETMFTETGTFSLFFTRYHFPGQFDLENVLAQDKLYLFDTADYWIETEDGGMGVDHDVALESAPIAREYDIEISK